MKLLPMILQHYRAAHPGIEVHIDGPDRQVIQWLKLAMSLDYR